MKKIAVLGCDHNPAGRWCQRTPVQWGRASFAVAWVMNAWRKNGRLHFRVPIIWGFVFTFFHSRFINLPCGFWMQQSQIFCLCQPAEYRFHKSLHIRTHADAGGAFVWFKNRINDCVGKYTQVRQQIKRRNRCQQKMKSMVDSNFTICWYSQYVSEGIC